MKKKKIIEECKHQFWKDRNPSGCLNCGKTEKELFLKKALSQQKAEIREIVKWMEKNGLDGHLPKSVESMSQRQKDIIQGESLGYNEALDDILKKLEEL